MSAETINGLTQRGEGAKKENNPGQSSLIEKEKFDLSSAEISAD
jgi:hypothetical protein